MAEKDTSSIGGNALYATNSHEHDKASAFDTIEEVGPVTAHGVPESHR